MKYEYVSIEDNKLAKLIEDKIKGSGFDYEFEWTTKGDILRLKTGYHVINDNGTYVGRTPVAVWFDVNKPEDFVLRINNNPFRCCYGLKEYAEDTVYNAILQWQALPENNQ